MTRPYEAILEATFTAAMSQLARYERSAWRSAPRPVVVCMFCHRFRSRFGRWLRTPRGAIGATEWVSHGICPTCLEHCDRYVN